MTFARIKSTAVVITAAASALFASHAFAQDGWHISGELGAVWLGDQPGYWQSPGPGDPRITFDVNGQETFAGFLSVGKTIMDGVRADLSFGIVGSQDIRGNWVSPPPAPIPPSTRPNDHANMDTSVSALTGMLNVSIEPLTLMGNNSAIQPFVTAGVGFARVSMDDWTRTNLATINPPARPVRTFEGDDSLNFAWSIGGGVTIDITETMNRPAYLDLSYRYMDLGNVSGGATPLPGNGAGNPIEPFNFDYTVHVITAGLRVPLY